MKTFALVLALLALTAAGCGGSDTESDEAANPNAAEVNEAGDIPDDQAFVEFAPDGAGYAVKVPEGWAQSEEGGAITFTDKLNSIRMEAVAAASAPTVESAKAKEVPALESAVKGFELAEVTTVKRSAGDAVLVTYDAESAPDEVTGETRTNAVERYEFFKDGTQVNLTLSGPKGADNVDPWKLVSDSLRWTE